MKIIFYSLPDPNGLCASFMRAADQLKLDHRFFDYVAAQQRHMPFGKLGFKVQQYVFIENLNHKVNRDFVVMAKDYEPDFIFFFTNAPVSAAALIFLKSILPQCRLVWVWPDSLLNVTQNSLNNFQLFDLIASYSSTSVDVLKTLTKGKVDFVPLAGDLGLHVMAPKMQPGVDIGFVGGWRPERQKRMEIIYHHFPNQRMEIYGPYWNEKCKNSPLKGCIKGTGLHGKAMAEFVNSTKINLNIIDDTNYPAANMRFFEILTAGGLELVSDCPEMEHIFMDHRDLLYFKNDEMLVSQIHWILSHDDKLYDIKMNGHQKILQEHNYTNRLSTIINSLA